VLDQPLRPQTKYANSGAVTIAYQVVGNAALDLLYIPGWFFNPEIWGRFRPNSSVSGTPYHLRPRDLGRETGIWHV
jgi:hypothetical protein